MIMSKVLIAYCSGIGVMAKLGTALRMQAHKNWKHDKKYLEIKIHRKINKLINAD